MSNNTTLLTPDLVAPSLHSESDKPSISGTFNFMFTGVYNRKTSKLCNLCGLNPKYPTRGLCKKCHSEKVHDAWVKSRPPKEPIPDLPYEIWSDIEDATGYQISNMGRVKSLNRYDEIGRHHLLKLREARKGGYLKADLDKYNIRPSVHRLVAKYFIPNPDNLPLVLHKDNNKQNNIYTNLYWGTVSKNRKDYIEHTTSIGVNRKQMPKQQVLDIYNSELSIQALSIKYNVETSTVWMIKNGYRWSSVTGANNTDKRKHK